MEAISYSITSVLDHVREAKYFYPDGSIECPFCGYGAQAPALRCENPGCPASKWAKPETRAAFQEQYDKAQARAKEQAERERNHEWAMKRIREENERRQLAYNAFVLKVRAAKGCMRCSDEYRGKVRKHRAGFTCPKERN